MIIQQEESAKDSKKLYDKKKLEKIAIETIEKKDKLIEKQYNQARLGSQKKCSASNFGNQGGGSLNQGSMGRDYI